MTKKYPNNYEEEWDDRVRPLMPSSYAPPEFMGLIHETHQYRGRTVEPTEEEEDGNV